MPINNVCDVSKCTGCGACAQLCPHEAIKMQPDEEGFLRPVVDKSLCTNCGLCQLRCPVNTPRVASAAMPRRIFSGWSNDGKVRMESSSGGAFSEIARLTLAEGGIVFGAALDGNLKVSHIFVDGEEGLGRLRGSKYVQSDMGDSYRRAKDFLSKGRKVLFAGTPCQVAGLLNFLHKDYANLTTVDFVCHGVPSPMVFADYVEYIEKNAVKGKVTGVNFRCKKSSWIFYSMGINSHAEKNGNVSHSYLGSYYADPYIRVFLRDNILRPCCYHCQYASIQRVSDFTIADWWGYRATSPEDKDFDLKGVSLVMCNTEKAAAMAECLDMRLRERTVEEAMRTNHSLSHPFPMPSTREEFWDDYRKMSFAEMVGKWMQPEKISLSLFLRIYHRSWHLLFLMAKIYEHIVRKFGLARLIIKVKSK